MTRRALCLTAVAIGALLTGCAGPAGSEGGVPSWSEPQIGTFRTVPWNETGSPGMGDRYDCDNPCIVGRDPGLTFDGEAPYGTRVIYNGQVDGERDLMVIYAEYEGPIEQARVCSIAGITTIVGYAPAGSVVFAFGSYEPEDAEVAQAQDWMVQHGFMVC